MTSGNRTLPSVTQILALTDLGPDFSRIPDSVMEKARRRGDAVHAAIELHGYGICDDVAPEIAPYLSAYEKFLVDTRHVPVVSEKEVISARWRYVGHVDRVGFQDEGRWLLDWKSSETLALQPVALQLAGYKIAWNELHPKAPVTVTAAVQLKRDGTYRLHVIDTKPVEHIFQAAVVVVHARGGFHGDDDRDRRAD